MAHYGIIAWIVIGGLAGAVAKLLMPGRDPGGCIITVLLGVCGALLAGWLGHAQLEALDAVRPRRASTARASSRPWLARSSFSASIAWSPTAAGSDPGRFVQATAMALP